MYNYKTLVFSYSLLVSMLSQSSVFTSPLGRSPPFWVSFPDMVAAVTMACIIMHPFRNPLTLNEYYSNCTNLFEFPYIQ